MIKAVQARKRYGDFELNLTLEIPYGRVTGLVGKNGAGKSTAIKTILGIVKTDSGSIKVMGKDAENQEAKDKENIGVCLSDAGFCPYLNVEDVVHILAKRIRW